MENHFTEKYRNRLSRYLDLLNSPLEFTDTIIKLKGKLREEEIENIRLEYKMTVLVTLDRGYYSVGSEFEDQKKLNEIEECFQNWVK